MMTADRAISPRIRACLDRSGRPDILLDSVSIGPVPTEVLTH